MGPVRAGVWQMGTWATARGERRTGGWTAASRRKVRAPRRRPATDTGGGSLGAVLPMAGRRVAPDAPPLTSSWVNEHLPRGLGADTGAGALPLPALPVPAEDGNNDSDHDDR